MANLVGISSESTSIPNNSRSNKAETPLNPMKPIRLPILRGRFFFSQRLPRLLVVEPQLGQHPLLRGWGDYLVLAMTPSRDEILVHLSSAVADFLLAKTQRRKEIVVHQKKNPPYPLIRACPDANREGIDPSPPLKNLEE
jgi:hypothetical protein